MPELTPRVGIKKPLGTDNVTRQSFNENWDIIDAKVATVDELNTHRNTDASTTQKGHVQIGTNLKATGGVISVDNGTTSTKGVVQLSAATDSASTALAATASAVKTVNDSLTAVKADNQYQTATIVGAQIRVSNRSNTNRLFFRLSEPLSGAITVSTDNGATSRTIVDIDGVRVTSLDKGFVEIVAESNFFILRNSGMSKSDLQSLIAIANEIESNSNTLKTNYINAVNVVDPNSVLPSTASWNDILLQIPNINANNKRWLAGIAYSNSANLLTVSGLPFIPSIVIIINGFEQYVSFKEKSSQLNPSAPTETAHGLSRSQSSYSSNKFTLNNDGFTGTTFGGSKNFNWIAIE